MGKRRRSPKKLFPDKTAKKGRPTPGPPSDGSADGTIMSHRPVAMGFPSSLSYSAVSTLAMMRARDILAQELYGIAYVDCAVIGVAGGEEIGLIKLTIE